MGIEILDERPTSNSLEVLYKNIISEQKKYLTYYWLCVEHDLWDASKTIEKMSRDEVERDQLQSVYTLPKTSLPPAKNTILCIPYARKGEDIGLMVFEVISTGEDVFINHLDENSLPLPLTKYRVGGGIDAVASDFSPQEWETYSEFTARIAFVFSLISEQSITKIEPFFSRQMRRRSLREGLELSIHKVVWNIGSHGHHKSTHSDIHNKKPLHFRRGHYRRAEAHFKGAKQINNEWYQWIDEMWVGHPAFGIKQSIHTPKIGRQKT